MARIDTQVTSVNAAGMAAYGIIFAMIQAARFNTFADERFSEHSEAEPAKHIYYSSSCYGAPYGTKMSYEITWDSSREIWCQTDISISNSDNEADYLDKVEPAFEQKLIDLELYECLTWSIKGVMTAREWSILSHMLGIFNFFGKGGIAEGDKELDSNLKGGDWRKQGGWETIPETETQYTTEWLRKLLPEWHSNIQ